MSQGQLLDAKGELAASDHEVVRLQAELNLATTTLEAADAVFLVLQTAICTSNMSCGWGCIAPHRNFKRVARAYGAASESRRTVKVPESISPRL